MSRDGAYEKSMHAGAIRANSGELSAASAAGDAEAVAARPRNAEKVAPPRDAETLADIAARAAAGDEAAFEQLYARYYRPFLTMLGKHCGGREDLAQDLAQQAITAFYVAIKAGRFDPSRSSLTTFAYAVANKTWLQHARTAGRYAAHVDTFAQLRGREKLLDEAGLQQTEAQETAAMLDALRAAMSGGGVADAAGLTEDERWLARAAASGESDRTLSKKMGLAPSNVNARKHAVYQKLRRFLAGKGFRMGPD